MTAADTVWITGASSGIGKALALLYAETGCTVFASARSAGALEELTQHADKLSGRIIAAPLDVTDAAAVDSLVSEFVNNNTLPNLCILNAGFYQVVNFDELDNAHFSKTMTVNYMGVVHCLLALLPPMRDRGNGQMAVVSSVAGYAGLPNAAAYGASKAALINMCESLKHDFARAGLDLCVINPGFVETPMTAKNSFPMPFLISTEQAAERIVKGLQSSAFEVTFPRRFTWLLKLVAMLPYSLFFWLTGRLAK